MRALCSRYLVLLLLVLLLSFSHPFLGQDLYAMAEALLQDPPGDPSTVEMIGEGAGKVEGWLDNINGAVAGAMALVGTVTTVFGALKSKIADRKIISDKQKQLEEIKSDSSALDLLDKLADLHNDKLKKIIALFKKYKDKVDNERLMEFFVKHQSRDIATIEELLAML